MIRRWLQTCWSFHKACRNLHSFPKYESLRVIDCREERLRLIDLTDTYACLSYVWGSLPHNESFDSVKSLRDIPRTIRDAMTVTLELGLRYLWVDRYYINQQDQNEKHGIISNMDQI